MLGSVAMTWYLLALIKSVQRQCSQDAAAEELLQGRKSQCRSGRATAPDESSDVPFIKVW